MWEEYRYVPWPLRYDSPRDACFSYWIHQHDCKYASLHLQGTSWVFHFSKKCARCLLSYDDREYYLRKFLNPYTDVLHKRQYNKQVIDICKKVVECPYWYDRCGVAM